MVGRGKEGCRVWVSFFSVFMFHWVLSVFQFSNGWIIGGNEYR